MKKYCFGIDVGGTTVKMGLFTTEGELLDKWEIPTRKEDGGAYILNDVAASVEAKLAEKNIAKEDVAGAGIGVPGPTLDTGYVSICVNLGWKDKNPANELSELLSIPVKAGNDANVAALGEMWKGGGEGYLDVVLLTLGTGVGGGIIINGEIENYTELTSGLDPQVITFGLNDSCDYYPSDITFDKTACASFTAMHHGTPVMDVKLHVPGMHNVSNALAAIALSLDLGISTDAILAGLSAFGGADRRFQYKGCVDGVTIIDDYAHHPTEIRATLTAAKNYPHKRLVLAFQPHTYSRTKAFLDDFADVLSMADVVVLADIYAAREKNTYGISSRDILAKLKEKGTECYYFPSFEEIEKFLLKNCINGDLLITMGAGDIVNVGEHLLGR